MEGLTLMHFWNFCGESWRGYNMMTLTSIVQRYSSAIFSLKNSIAVQGASGTQNIDKKRYRCLSHYGIILFFYDCIVTLAFSVKLDILVLV